MQNFPKWSAAPCLVLASSVGYAADSLPDSELADVTGQSGLAIQVNGDLAASSGNVQWNPNAGSSASATEQFSGLTIGAIGSNGATSSGPGTFTISSQLNGSNGAGFDVGSNGTTTGMGLDMRMTWGRTRISAQDVYAYQGDATAATATHTNGFGSFALDTSGTFALVQQTSNGLLSYNPPNIANNQLYLTIGSPQIGVVQDPVGHPYGQFYYRQGAVGSPELILDRVWLQTGFAAGVGGVIGMCGPNAPCGQMGSTPHPFVANASTGQNVSGLYLATPKLDFNFTYALNYRGNPGTNGFTTTQNDVLGLAYWGWTGDFQNAELVIGSGGGYSVETNNRYDPNVPTTRNQGLNLAFHGNYDPGNFNWVVGQAGGGTLLEFGGWTKFGDATWGLSAPNITLSVINSSQGVGGLCWGAGIYGNASSGCGGASLTWPYGYHPAGAEFLNMTPTATNIDSGTNLTAIPSLWIRNMSLQAWSTNVTVLDDKNGNGIFDAGESQTYNWGLIYTLGTADGNISLYPGNGSGGDGLKADILFMSQSFNNKTTNTTNNPLYGNTNFMIEDTSSKMAVGYYDANFLLAMKAANIVLGSDGIHINPAAMRLGFEGMFGGASLANAGTPGGTVPVVKGFLLDVNLESNNPSFVFSPKNTQMQDTDYSWQNNGSGPNYGYNNPNNNKPYPYLGYSGNITFGTVSGFGTASPDGSYISMAEPSSPSTDIRIANLTGSISIQNGRVFLISGSDPYMAPDGVQRLQIAQDIYFGSTAGGSALNANVNFSGANIGQISIPSGQMFTSLILKHQ